jgi:hypothetical protein
MVILYHVGGMPHFIATIKNAPFVPDPFKYAHQLIRGRPVECVVLLSSLRLYCMDLDWFTVTLE